MQQLIDFLKERIALCQRNRKACHDRCDWTGGATWGDRICELERVLAEAEKLK
jgi:hypothetical protein